jgi:hypothetical protein
MQRDGKLAFCAAVFAPLLCVRTAHIVRTKRNVILDGCTEQSMRSVCHANFSPGPLSVRRQDIGLNEKFLRFSNEKSIFFKYIYNI